MADELFGRAEPGPIDWSPPPFGVDPVIDEMRTNLRADIYGHFGATVLANFEKRYGAIDDLRIGCLRYWSDRIRDEIEGEDREERARMDSGEIEV